MQHVIVGCMDDKGVPMNPEVGRALIEEYSKMVSGDTKILSIDTFRNFLKNSEFHSQKEFISLHRFLTYLRESDLLPGIAAEMGLSVQSVLGKVTAIEVTSNLESVSGAYNLDGDNIYKKHSQQAEHTITMM